jgi:multidrug resistance efflux pump
MGDYRTTEGEKHPLTFGERRRRSRRLWLVLVSFFALLLLAGVLIRVDRYVTASGYVTTENYAEVRPASVGKVAQILKYSGTVVQKGDLLVQLDASEEMAMLEEAMSRMNKTEAEVARRQAEIAEKKREQKEHVAMAKLRLENVSANLRRTRELLEKGLVAGSALENDQLREDLARAELVSLQSRDETIYDKELAVLRQELEARGDAVKRARARVRSREILAPIAGQVLRYEFVIGELVRPESVLYEIFGGDRQVLKLRVAERYATRVADGQAYHARLAPYRGLKQIWFTGKLLSLRNVIQTEGQQTYRVAYCSFEANGFHVPPGTTAEAKIFYGQSCFWFYLFGID